MSTAKAVQVQGLSSGVTAIAASVFHTCAIHDGAAKCWGGNNNGQLGDDSQSDRATPVQVIGLTEGVTAIALGGLHSCAIQNSAAKCWGWNAFGQLGDETRTSRTSPVQVFGLTANVTAITASGHRNFGDRSAQGSSCAIHQGFAKCWGSNYRGQLGNGEGSPTDPTVDRSFPVYVLDPLVLEAPTQLRPVAVTANSIEVRWNPPILAADVLAITNYRVSWDVNTPVSDASTTVFIAASENDYKITGLLPNRLYYIVVTAANSRGSGVPSTPLEARTLGLAGVEAQAIEAQSIAAGGNHTCVLINGPPTLRRIILNRTSVASSRCNRHDACRQTYDLNRSCTICCSTVTQLANIIICGEVLGK